MVKSKKKDPEGTPPYSKLGVTQSEWKEKVRGIFRSLLHFVDEKRVTDLQAKVTDLEKQKEEIKKFVRDTNLYLDRINLELKKKTDKWDYKSYTVNNDDAIKSTEKRLDILESQSECAERKLKGLESKNESTKCSLSTVKKNLSNRIDKLNQSLDLVDLTVKDVKEKSENRIGYVNSSLSALRTQSERNIQAIEHEAFQRQRADDQAMEVICSLERQIDELANHFGLGDEAEGNM